MKETILKELKAIRTLDTCNDFVLWADDSDLEHLANRLEKAITVTHCCTPKGTVKTIDFERTIDLLDAEIDSLKDAYRQEAIVDRKTVYSSMILETLHAKKKLKQ